MDYTPTESANPGNMQYRAGPNTPMTSQRELNARSADSSARHQSYNVMLDQLDEMRSQVSQEDYNPASAIRDNNASPAMHSVDESSFYRAYNGATSEMGYATSEQPPYLPALSNAGSLGLVNALGLGSISRMGSLAPMPAVPPMIDTYQPALQQSMSQMSMGGNQLYGNNLAATSSFASSAGVGLGLVGMSAQPQMAAQTPYTAQQSAFSFAGQPYASQQPSYAGTPYGTPYVGGGAGSATPGGYSAQQVPYVSPRDEDDYDDEEDDYTEDQDSYGGAPDGVVDMYSDGARTPQVPVAAAARYAAQDYRERDIAASSNRTRNTNAGTDRTAVDYNGRSYLTTPTQVYGAMTVVPPTGYQTPRGYPQTPGSRSAVAPQPGPESERAARYYYKRPDEKPVAWWRKSICHFIGLAMAALCSFWLLNWIFGGLSWSLRSKQITLVVGIEPQILDTNYQLVNYTLASPVDSMLGGALAVDYIYGITREQVVALVDSDQRYIAMFVSKDYSQTLLSRSVPAIVEFIHDSGKNYKTVRDLLFSMVLFNEKLRVAIATEFVRQNVSASVGYWLTGPVKLSYSDIHPVNTEGQNIFAYMSNALLWFACIFIATIASWMVHPVTPMRATEFGWRLGGAGIMLFLLTIGTSLVPLILNGQFVGVGSSGDGWAASWGWMMFTGVSYLGIISFTYQLAGRDLGQALMLVFGFIQFGTSWGLLDQNLSMLAYQIGKGFPMYWGIVVLRFIYFGSLSSYVGTAVAVIFAWILAMCSLSILLWFMGWNRVGQQMQKYFANKVWLGDPKLLGLDDDKTEVYSQRE